MAVFRSPVFCFSIIVDQVYEFARVFRPQKDYSKQLREEFSMVDGYRIFSPFEGIEQFLFLGSELFLDVSSCC